MQIRLTYNTKDISNFEVFKRIATAIIAFLRNKHYEERRKAATHKLVLARETMLPSYFKIFKGLMSYDPNK